MKLGDTFVGDGKTSNEAGAQHRQRGKRCGRIPYTVQQDMGPEFLLELVVVLFEMKGRSRK